MPSPGFENSRAINSVIESHRNHYTTENVENHLKQYYDGIISGGFTLFQGIGYKVFAALASTIVMS